jgi:hypothetical protein
MHAPKPRPISELESSVNAVQTPFPAVSEMSDDYPAVVAVLLDGKMRVIAADIQWIVQKRVREGRWPWQSIYFCRTKAGLLLCAGRTKPDVAPPPPPPELLALPDRFPEAA